MEREYSASFVAPRLIRMLLTSASWSRRRLSRRWLKLMIRCSVYLILTLITFDRMPFTAIATSTSPLPASAPGRSRLI